MDADRAYPDDTAYKSAAGIVTGTPGHYYAWHKPDRWTSRRIGGSHDTLAAAIAALEDAAMSSAAPRPDLATGQ